MARECASLPGMRKLTCAFLVIPMLACGAGSSGQTPDAMSDGRPASLDASLPPTPDADVLLPPDPAMVAFIEAVEEAEALVGEEPTRMLSVLRKLYYGAEWSVSSTSQLWDVMIPCGADVADPRPVLGPALHARLTSPVEVAGRDVGHVFAVLEATICPQESVLGVNMNNEDFSGWPGDVGSAIAMRYACEKLGSDGFDCGGMAGGSLDYYLDLMAGDPDMEGDLDPLAMRAGEMGQACTGSAGLPLVLSRPVSQLMRDYYLNSSSTLGASRRQRNRCVLELMGGVFNDTTLTNRAAVEAAYAGPIAANAALYYIYSVNSLPSLTDRAAMDTDAEAAMSIVVGRMLASETEY